MDQLFLLAGHPPAEDRVVFEDQYGTELVVQGFLKDVVMAQEVAVNALGSEAASVVGPGREGDPHLGVLDVDVDALELALQGLVAVGSLREVDDRDAIEIVDEFHLHATWASVSARRRGPREPIGRIQQC